MVVVYDGSESGWDGETHGVQGVVQGEDVTNGWDAYYLDEGKCYGTNSLHSLCFFFGAGERLKSETPYQILQDYDVKFGATIPRERYDMAVERMKELATEGCGCK